MLHASSILFPSKYLNSLKAILLVSKPNSSLNLCHSQLIEQSILRWNNTKKNVKVFLQHVHTRAVKHEYWL